MLTLSATDAYNVNMISTRERLIEAAISHLERDGLHGLTLREIARNAGVSHGTPVRHFASLAAMLSAVAARSFDELQSAVSAAVQLAGDDPLDRLAAAGAAYVEFAMANASAYELMFRPELLSRDDPDYLRASWAAFEQLADLTADAQTTRWRSNVDHMTLTGVLWAGVHGIASLSIQGALPAATAIEDFAPFLNLFIGDFASLPTPSESRS